jgi:hypothetical protein
LVCLSAVMDVHHVSNTDHQHLHQCIFVLCIHKLWTCWQIECIEIFPCQCVQSLILFIISICPNSGFTFPIFSSSVATTIWRHKKGMIHTRRWGREWHSWRRWLTFIRAGITGGSGERFSGGLLGIFSAVLPMILSSQQEFLWIQLSYRTINLQLVVFSIAESDQYGCNVPLNLCKL